MGIHRFFSITSSPIQVKWQVQGLDILENLSIVMRAIIFYSLHDLTNCYLKSMSSPKWMRFSSSLMFSPIRSITLYIDAKPLGSHT
jgi:hypothetical protein